MIKYIGSKRKFTGLIVETISELSPSGTVIDLFSGTARVGHALKSAGYKVYSNDINAYAATIARCYVQADTEVIARAAPIIEYLNSLPGKPGYFTETFCEKSRFFQPKNGARIDAIRERIAEAKLDPELEAVLLVSLMEAADRVDSTCGVQMAYLKQWAPRASKDLHLRMPDVLPEAPPGKGTSFQLDALEAAKQLSAEVAYLDPPYNQHKYLGNYHIWETLVKWDAPEVYGVACKRVDCRGRKSPFNSKPRIHAAMKEIINELDVDHIVVSFSNEGYISKEEMIDILSARGEVRVIESDYTRYIGAQIGIHNQQGVEVGQVSHTKNKEYIFTVSEKT